MDAHKELTSGHRAECQAKQFLQQHGLKLLTQNFHSRLGEIDLVMLDKDEVVFVEVRFRQNTGFGSAIESVNQIKQRKIARTAVLYLQKEKLLDQVNCRFDIIGINYKENRPIFEWIKDAFSLDFYL